MANARMKLAVYTTIYPGVEPYLPDWCRSLLGQTDQSFDLWIGLDTLGREAVKQVLGGATNANWVITPRGATPAEIRQQALLKVVELYDGVVLVDSDDILAASRVAMARDQLSNSDLTGCALSIVDQSGRDLGATFGALTHGDMKDVLPRNNVFGFSNSAFRTELLRRCLPIPAEAVLVDWYLATRAWLLGARMDFDPTPRMGYRQHPGNTARVRRPFSIEQVASDAQLVRRHFQLVLAEPLPAAIGTRWEEVRQVASEVEEFCNQIVADSERMELYVSALNALPLQPVWWACVANPALAHMWTEQRVSA
jgi:hypothetical protein